MGDGPGMAEADARVARWDRLKALFNGALEQPLEARERWLREAAGDDALFEDARSLLEAHDTAGDFLERPPMVEVVDRIGPYVILEEIGRGGMGVVYLAEDERLGRRVALKSLPHAAAADPAFRERLRREARAAATLSHPDIAVVYALEEIDDQIFVVSEYVPGRTLREELQEGPIEDARVAAIVGDIAGALAAAHAAGIVHRDLKPENIILPGAGIRESGSVKIVDFGIAYIEGLEATRLTLDGAVIGTPAYMAPEQLSGGGVDSRADIYALGVILRELISGRPSPLTAIATRCLQHDPAERYQSANELLADLEPRTERTRNPEPGTRNRVLFWWQFHQATAALTYWVMVIAAWRARVAIGGTTGRVIFIATLAAVIVAANLRLHLWFTSRFYPRELPWLRRRVRWWIHGADWLYALTLVAASLLLEDERSPLAVLLLSFGIGSAVAFLVIEPATARAAFGRDQ